MGQRTKNTENIIAVNKKATYDYFILEKIEAGIVLEGWEVKGIRDLKVQLKEAYVKINKGDVILIGSNITPPHYINNNTINFHTSSKKKCCVNRPVSILSPNPARSGLCGIFLPLNNINLLYTFPIVSVNRES